MVSPVKTGKSTIISNLLLNEHFYGHEYFDDVFVISNTINNDQTSRFIKEHFDVEDHYNDSMIDVLVERQMSYKKKDQPEVALILDDILEVRLARQYAQCALPPLQHQAPLIQHSGVSLCE